MKIHNYHKFYEYLAPPIKVTLPPKIITISTDSSGGSSKLICQNGIIYFTTDFYDDSNIFDISTMEEKTEFKTMITTSYYQQTAGVTCRLWKQNNNSIYIICKSDEDLYTKLGSSFDAYFNETTFDYKDYRVIITSSVSYSFVVSNAYCPFLYANDLSINLRDEDTSYELKFKVESYNKEPLIISTEDMYYIGLENCTRDLRNLICKIDKEKILEQYNNQIFKLYYITELNGFQKFDLMPEVTITNSIIQKETIYVQILSLLSTRYDLYNYVAYSTNVTKISNVFTGHFILDANKPVYCFLKKAGNDPLYLLCRWPYTGSFSLGQIKSQIILDNINIRYNFRITKGSGDNYTFTIGGHGALPLYIYPRVIDFYLNDSITVYIRMQYPEYITSIYLGNNYLSCDNTTISLLPFKKCIINKNLFGNGIKQYYNLTHNNYYTSKAPFYELAPIYVKTPSYNEIIMRIKKENNMDVMKVGNNGVLCFITSYQDDLKIFYDDIETMTTFNSKVFDENNNEYDVNCRLWNPQGEKIRIICRLNQNLKYETQNIMLKDYSFEIKGYYFYIYSDSYIEANQLNYDISFLYSPPQYIETDSDTSSFNLTFKIESYNNKDDLLYLYGSQNNYLIIDNCEAYGKELTCKILREKIDEILTNVNSNFSVGIMNDNFGAYKLNNILNITIYRYYYPKINVYVSLGNNFGRYTKNGVPFGYVTNVSNIENLITDKYDICYFKKIKGKNLLYACIIEETTQYYFRGTSSNTNLINIHWKYNFILTPYSKYEYFYIEGSGSIFKYVYPDSLDYSNKDSFIIRYIMTEPTLATNIKLEYYSSSNLQCEDLNEMKKCIIPYAHFRSSSTGYFFTYYYSYGSYELTEYYSLSPIYVNLSSFTILEFAINDNNNRNILYLGQEPVLYLITNFNDTLSNIFDYSIFSFNATFSTNQNSKVIEGTCDFWKPKDNIIRFICRLKDKFENDEQIIKVNENSFTYNDYKIIFYSDAYSYITAKQLKSKNSFLYSDKQEINMDASTDSYTLRFEKKIYNKQQIELYNNNGLKKVILNCNEEETKVSCNIKKGVLTQILSYSGEQFYVSQIVDSEGILPIDSILGITFNYLNAPKTEINIQITNLLTPNVDYNNFIVYETNVEDIPIISTNIFNIAPNRNDATRCLFKKNNEKGKLLLLCLANTLGEITLGQIDEITLDNINILYNFKIAATQKDDKITVKYGQSAIITSVNPTEIDFNKKSSYTIIYETNSPELLTGIKLNKDSSELECTNRMGSKECIVTNAHFKKSGDYYTYHDNNFGTKSISYEITTIKVTIKEKEEDDSGSSSYAGVIAGSVIGGIILICLIILLIWMYKKKCANTGNNNNSIEEKKAPLKSQDQIELNEEPKELE